MKNVKCKNRRFSLRGIVLSAVVLLFAGMVYGQNIPVNGTVTDATGELIIGASISEKGNERNGTITDVDGKFSLQTRPDAVLTISYIGYARQEISVGNGRNLSIVLQEDRQQLEEVVVIGYGTQKKVNLTGAVSQIKVDQKISNRSVTNVSSALTGLAPGLAAIQSSGMAGQNNASLIIRGMSTVNNTNPLIVVDGVPDVDINRLNINDIETVSVLKDAASAAVYGSRAANGVILVTTRSGKGEEKTHFDFTGNYGISHPVKSMGFMSDYSRAMTTAQRAQAVSTLPQNFRYKNGAIDQWMALGMIDPILYPNTDWWDVILRNSPLQNYTLSASGSNDRSNFYGSIGITDQEGMLINNDYQMYSVRFNFDYKLQKNLHVGFRFNGNWSTFHFAREIDIISSDQYASMSNMSWAPAGMTPYDPVTGRYGAPMAYGEDVGGHNLLGYYENEVREENRKEANGSAYVEWEIIEGLTARVDYALNYNHRFNWHARTPWTTYDFQHDIDRVVMVGETEGVTNSSPWGYKTMLNGRVNYHKLIAGHHDLQVTLVGSEEYWYARSLSASRNDRIHPALHEIDAALTNTQSTSGGLETEGLRSYVGRLNYTAYDRYLLELNFRSDGSSKFAKGHQWGFFPSVALGWRFSEEGFLKNWTKDWLSSGKIRASYGEVGNNSGVGRFEQSYVLNTKNYFMGGSVVKGFVNGKLLNESLTWETTRQTNIGLDLAFFKGRLSADLDYYDRLTFDMIRPSDISTLLANAYAAPRTNIGDLRNRGFEIDLKWQDRIGRVNYSLGANFSHNWNRLEEWNQYLGLGNTFIDMPYHFVYSYEDTGIAQTWQDTYIHGWSTGSAPGDILRVDKNGDGRIDGNDRVAYPNQQVDRPTTNYALTGYVEWQGIDVSFLLQGTAGNQVFWLNSLNNINPPDGRYTFSWLHWNDTWNWENRDASLPRLNGSGNRDQTTFWLDNMAYLRLKNLQLGYTLPKRWLSKLHVDHFRIYGTGENLLTLTKYRGIDPEVTNVSRMYPLVKSYSVGVNIGF
ncbi:MAG: TonB-dependent receptor [Tannerella sp.]|jgi:TonB-linked SusC/RagA family outer membrane protein|nr:TonB-dependent receptor [Tannerella sp.]